MPALRNFVIGGQGKLILPELKDLTGKFTETSVTHSTEKSTGQTLATSFHLHLTSLQHTRPLSSSSHARLMHLSAQHLQASPPARHHLCPVPASKLSVRRHHIRLSYTCRRRSLFRFIVVLFRAQEEHSSRPNTAPQQRMLLRKGVVPRQRRNLHLSCRSFVSALHLQTHSWRYLWTPLPRRNSSVSNTFFPLH